MSNTQDVDFMGLLKTHTNIIKADPSLVELIETSTSTDNTQFVHLKQRIWHLAHGLKSQPVCPVCNSALVKWDKQNAKYSLTCGYKCSAALVSSSPAVKDKRRETNLKRYGVTSPAKNKEVVAKATATKIERYGADGGEVWRDKIKSAVMRKHGVDNPSRLPEVNAKKQQAWLSKQEHEKDEIIRKRQQTWINNYGVDNPSKSPLVREKTRSTIEYRYGVSNPQQSPNIRARTTSTNIERYGAVAPSGNADVRSKISETNTRNHGGRHNTQLHLSDETARLLGDRDWLVEQHHSNKLSPTYIARTVLGVTEHVVLDRMQKFGIEHLRFQQSGAELELGDWLETSGLSILRSDRKLLGGRELDIYIPTHNVAIEYCGLYWHSDIHDRMDSKTHKSKLDACTARGIRLITIFEDEWAANRPIVEQKLLSILGQDNRPSVAARKCVISTVTDSYKKAEFYTKHHIQGDGPGSITYSLTDGDNHTVAMMSFIRQSGNVFVLNRYATSCRVPGGFSKLLTHFTRNHDWSQVVSFADLRWSEGGVYRNNGFTLDKLLPPDYYWVVDGRRDHKFAWRHANRLRNLPKYSSSMSESENMRAHGYHKIYNCGLQRWVMMRES